MLQIVLQYDGLFGFTVEIDVPKEEDEIDLLKKEINELRKKVRLLKEDNIKFNDKIKHIDLAKLLIKMGREGIQAPRGSIMPHSIIQK